MRRVTGSPTEPDRCSGSLGGPVRQTDDMAEGCSDSRHQQQVAPGSPKESVRGKLTTPQDEVSQRVLGMPAGTPEPSYTDGHHCHAWHTKTIPGHVSGSGLLDLRPRAPRWYNMDLLQSSGSETSSMMSPALPGSPFPVLWLRVEVGDVPAGASRFRIHIRQQAWTARCRGSPSSGPGGRALKFLTDPVQV